MSMLELFNSTMGILDLFSYLLSTQTSLEQPRTPSKEAFSLARLDDRYFVYTSFHVDSSPYLTAVHNTSESKSNGTLWTDKGSAFEYICLPHNQQTRLKAHVKSCSWRQRPGKRVRASLVKRKTSLTHPHHTHLLMFRTTWTAHMSSPWRWKSWSNRSKRHSVK